MISVLGGHANPTLTCCSGRQGTRRILRSARDYRVVQRGERKGIKTTKRRSRRSKKKEVVLVWSGLCLL